MKNLNKAFLLVFLLSFTCIQAHTLTFNGCHELFGDQNYTFKYAGTDASGMNFYITTPVDATQSCGGLGTCEFMIKGDTATSKWNFLADSGNGFFIEPLLIYSNNLDTSPRPPNLLQKKYCLATMLFYS